MSFNYGLTRAEMSRMTVADAEVYNKVVTELQTFARQLDRVEEDTKNHGYLIADLYKKLNQDREDWEMVQGQVFGTSLIGCGEECIDLDDLEMAGGSDDVEFYKIAKRNIELPRDGEEYWYVEADGTVESEFYDVNAPTEYIDWERWKFGNYFRSKEDAERASQKIKEALGGA